jgi:hypothetical protein
MTTIAWDGKTLATDSRRVSGDTVECDNDQKLYLNVGGYLAVAESGCCFTSGKIFDWIKNNKTGEFPKIENKDENAASIVCVTDKGSVVVYRYDGEGMPIHYNDAMADGSGWQIALGAMDAGAGAMEAIEIAVKRDINSGGGVQSYTFKG